MRKRITAALAAAAILVLGALGANFVGPVGSADSASQQAASQGGGGLDQVGTPKEVVKMLKEIDHERVQASVEKLVSFGTRNTLSSQDDPDRGIGAARDWLYSEFQKYAADSGGRMTVELDSYLQPVASRIPVPTVITNVVATLRGTQPESTNRMYVVSGHYDSMCGSPTDPTCDAPGAGDDASGVAAVLEMARVMAKREWESTIVFMAVAGEEQGLYGSNHFAEEARAANLQIEGMFTNDIVGSSTGGTGIRDPFSVRVVRGRRPDRRDNGRGEHAAVGGRRERLAGEADGTLRQVGSGQQPHEHGDQDHLPARPLRARRRSHLLPRERLPLVGSLHRGERGLRPSASERPRRERRADRRPARVRRLQVHRPRGKGECDLARGARGRAGGAQGRQDRRAA